MNETEITCSPIGSSITNVILWTRNLEKSVTLYRQLFSVSPEQEKAYPDNNLHFFDLVHGGKIMIDANGMDKIPVPESSSPLFFIPADDIDDAAAFVQQLGFQLVYGGITRYPQVSFFNMRDDDFNVITVCQNH